MVAGLCKYKNIFGEPGTGIHSYRVFDVAIIDVLSTLLGAYVISVIFKYTTVNQAADNSSKGFQFVYVAAALFLLGIIMHRLFCVRTTIDKILFP